jgi:membrane-bound metal-dependent hydrolase YbcI (DUF457 family)
MKGLTHKAGGTLGMLVAFEILKNRGMLLPNINPYIQLLFMYPAASWGSTAPDLDLLENSTAEHNPVSMAIGGALKLLGAKHRSWQTHCIAITGGLTIIIPVLLETWGVRTFGKLDLSLLRLLVYGLSIGIFSHLILDALTPEGIHLIPNIKIHLVPKIAFFRTGGLWEKLVCVMLYIAIGALLVYWGLGGSIKVPNLPIFQLPTLILKRLQS